MQGQKYLLYLQVESPIDRIRQYDQKAITNLHICTVLSNSNE